MTDLLRIARQMGPRWTAYQAGHRLRAALGVPERRIPADPPALDGLHTPLAAFRQNPPAFFFAAPPDGFWRKPDAQLAQAAQRIADGWLPYFGAADLPLPRGGGWRRHPLTQRDFPQVHWSRVPDFDPGLGDIKYVWEPSRFSHLLTLVRDDFHNGTDRGTLALGQISDWIEANPVNVGPNYKCSQEISLRLLNWTFALHYYRDHPALDEALWARIQRTVYWSLHHVRHYIEHSRVAVRNNHALTETLALWIGGLLYPWMRDVAAWSREGKAWFAEEVAYQFHLDGTYLQHSHTYQRVASQLLAWGLRLGELHGDALPPVCYERARASVAYLSAVMRPDGRLPNYGSNDGALFFPLASQAFRDFRPQVDALARACRARSPVREPLEEARWLGVAPATRDRVDATRVAAEVPAAASLRLSYPLGGVHAFEEGPLFAFIKAQGYRDRPHQADNLHLDLWLGAENVLRDQGTYRYNADDPADRDYFFGTASHNTVQLGRFDQMRKGPRFVWFDWTVEAEGAWINERTFRGSFAGFAEAGPRITHTRTVHFGADGASVTVTDEIANKPPGVALRQLWHPHPAWLDRLGFAAETPRGRRVTPERQPGYFSDTYGVKEACTDLVLATDESALTTTIRWR